MSAHPQLLTRREAAAYLRVSMSWLNKGNGPPMLRMGGVIRYRMLDLDAYLEASLQCSSKSPDQAIGTQSLPLAENEHVEALVKRAEARRSGLKQPSEQPPKSPHQSLARAG